MAKRLSSEEAFQRAENIRADWEAGRYETLTALAQAYDLAIVYVRKIVLGLKCVRIDPPGVEGKHRKRIVLEGVHFSVFKDGRIWSHALNKFLTPTIDDGYQHFNVKRQDGKGRIKIRVHRLILSTWKRPPKPGEQALHKDDDRTNNHVKNLRWGTNADNVLDRIKNGGTLIGEHTCKAKLTEEIVAEFYTGYVGQKKTDYVRDFIKAKRLDIGENTMLSILAGRYWNHVTKDLSSGYVHVSDEMVKTMRRVYRKNKGRGPVNDFCKHYSTHLSEQGHNIGWKTIKNIVTNRVMRHVG